MVVSVDDEVYDGGWNSKMERCKYLNCFFIAHKSFVILSEMCMSFQRNGINKCLG